MVFVLICIAIIIVVSFVDNIDKDTKKYVIVTTILTLIGFLVWAFIFNNVVN